MAYEFGSALKLSIFGTSHGPAVGMLMHGLPADFQLDMARLQRFLRRRAPGTSPLTTQRKEADRPIFLSGIDAEGRTLGTAVCAIIPYVGAFISCSVSILLTLLLDPTLVIRCFLVYVTVQFIENQFIYPRVVGESVGLPPVYTLIAAMIGGKLFGIIGIIFFIPLTAVIIELVSDDANQRLQTAAVDADP